MDNRLFSAFDEVTIGTHLQLTDDDLVLSVSSDVPIGGIDAHRLARSVYDVLFPSNVEFIISNPDGLAPSLLPVGGVPPVLCGICARRAKLFGFLGEDVQGFGYCAGDGYVYNNNAQLQFVGTASYGDKIGILVDPIKNTMVVSKNGVPLGNAVPITAAKSWFYAATVSGLPNQYVIEANAGQTPIRFQPSVVSGWWIARPQIRPMNLASESWMSRATDVRRHEKFRGDIAAAEQDVVISDSVRPWMWGDSAPEELGADGLVQMQINDANGTYVDLTKDEARGGLVQMLRVKSNADATTAEPIFTGLFDHCDPDTKKTRQVYFRDYTTRLAGSVRRALFPRSADPTVAGKQRPVSAGICRNFTPTLENAATLQYALSDGPITGIGRFRVAGAELLFTIDFNLTTDLEDATLAVPPVGTFTAETSSDGTAVAPTIVDYMAGVGDFSSAAGGVGGQPAGWTGSQYGGGAGTWQLSGVSPNKVVTQPQQADQISWFYPNVPIVIKPGRSYGYSFELPTIPYFGQAVDGNGTVVNELPGRLLLGYFQNQNILFWNFEQVPIDHVGVYSGIFVNTTGVNKNFVLGFACNGIISGSNPLQIKKMKLFELPALATNVDFDDGPGLTSMVKAFAVKRGPLDPAEVQTSDTDAIDAATGYHYGLHIAPDESPSVDSCLQQLVDSCCAVRYFDANGILRIKRMYAPEDVDDGDLAGELKKWDVEGELLSYEDLAEKLTTRISGCRNYQTIGASEYGDTSLIQVPLNVRAQLADKLQWTEPAGVPLAMRYRDASNRDPHETLLDLRAHGKSEITFVNTLYKVARNFYGGWFFEPPSRTFNLMDCWKLTYDLPTLVAGTKLMIVGRKRRPAKELCKLILWGK